MASRFLSAQSLNRRGSIQRRVIVQDSAGQPAEQWETMATVWMAIRFITGAAFVNREQVAGGSEVSRPSAMIKIRHRTDVDAGMRVLSGGVSYDIRAVLPDEQDRRYVDLGCVTGASSG